MIKPGWRTWTVFLESLDKKDELHNILVKHNAWKVHFPSQIVLTEVASYVGNKIRVSVAVKALCAGFKNKKSVCNKFSNSEKATKIWKIYQIIWDYILLSDSLQFWSFRFWWDFLFKLLWPSQNIWTLTSQVGNQSDFNTLALSGYIF